MKLLVFITILFFMAYAPLRWSVTSPLRRHIGPGFVVSWLVPIAIGVLIHAPGPYLFSILALFLLTTRGRIDTICRFVMLSMLLPQVYWQISIGSLYLVRISTVAVLSFSVAIKYGMFLNKKYASLSKYTPEDTIVFILIMIIWIGAGRFQSATDFMRNGVQAAVDLALPYVIFRRGLRSSEEFMRVVACLAIAAGIVATFAIYETRHSWALFDTFRTIGNPDALSSNVYRRGGSLRAVSTMAGALMLGVGLLIGVTATFYSRSYVRQNWMLYCWGGVIFLGMMMAQSRGNTALLPFAILIFCLQRRKYGYAAAIVIAVPVLLAALIEAARFSPKIAGFLQIGVQASGPSADVYDYRQVLLRRGMEVGATHRWTGQGMDDVLRQLADITQGEHIVDLVNSYLTFYLTSGLAGLVPLVLVFGMILWKLVSTRTTRLRNPMSADLRGFALTALVVVAVQLAFMSFIDRMPLFLFITLAAARILRIERRSVARGSGREAAPSGVAPIPRTAMSDPGSPSLAG